MSEFVTIIKNEEYILTEKKSKFIANLIKIDNVQEAENEIKRIKKLYHDARHNCIAYRVIDGDNVIEKSSDDGEPSGTAGAPMLNILKKNNLCNVLIVVTRYFGGILLGTGGLVRAYSDALSGAIKQSTIVQKTMGIEMEVTIEYNQFEKFQYYCKINNIQIEDTQYLDNIICKITMEEVKKPKIIKDIENKSINIIDYGSFNKKIIIKSIL